MWSIAYKTLLADRGKLLTALAGVVFSVVLVNVQGGLFIGLIRKVSLLVDIAEADVWVGHKNMHNVDFPRDIPRRWIHRIRTVPGVKRVEPMLMGLSEMTLPSGGSELVLVVGTEPESRFGRVWNLAGSHPGALLRPDGIVVDVNDDAKLEDPAIGDLREIGGRRARVAAKSKGITGFLVTPYVFTLYDRAAAYLRRDPNVSSYFLVRLQPWANSGDVCRLIRERVPDVEAFSREKYSRTSINFWMTRTGLGISFGAATLLGIFVGMIIIAQTLYALVLDRLEEFGTLKAIGATERHIFTMLLFQAWTMATAGSIVGLGVVAVVQRLLSTPRAPIVIPASLCFGSCVLVLLICLVSSLLPYLRVRKIDPLIVMQS